MKRSSWSMLAWCFCALAVITAANAAPKKAAMAPVAAGAAEIKTYIGMWNCASATNPRTASFIPLFNGNAMQVTSSGKPPSAEYVMWDSRRKVYIDEFVNGSGAYMVFEGKHHGNPIIFNSVYGPKAKLVVVRTSPTQFYDDFTLMAGSASSTMHEVCTKK